MIDITFESGIAVVAMNHGKVNAMDLEFCNELMAKLEELKGAEFRGIVLGSSLRAFSAGIDLKRWLNEGPEYVQPYMDALERLFEMVFSFPKPIVADINGPAIAGGCMVAAACDYRVIVKSSKMGILESRLGVPLPMMAIEIMRHVASASAFKKIVSVGATYDGPKAVNAGLADVCVSDGTESRIASIEAANELAMLPAAAFELTKQQRTLPVLSIAHENRRQLYDKYIKIWQSEETRIAIREYVEQRLS